MNNSGSIDSQKRQLTGSQEMDQVDLVIADILGQYGLEQWQAVIRHSGMNNTTRLIESVVGRFAIRVYDNHQDNSIVALEHDMLFYLIELNFALKVPEPIRNMAGNTITVSNSGKLASLFRYIDGDRPSSRNAVHIRSLGRATGLLSAALASYQSDRVPVYKPYYELDQSYADWSNENIISLAERSKLGLQEMEAIHRILEIRKSMNGFLQSIRSLPHQWIHGDLNFSNAVAVDDCIVGILDFEFCTIDLRAMEPAVVLVDFIHADRTEHERITSIAEYTGGFGETRKLTREEADAIPGLMKLRMLDVFLHFAGRRSEGLDEPAVWEGQIRHADSVCRWIQMNEPLLIDILRSSLSE
ncbi:phosphotransferase [Paenibacillus xylaniclasticus]|uniref:phosphotransferase n=1 Tax=Paenibacillus xylaniclasticus TaxID=588083 RepID=UPI000FDAD88B|nr:MULTISPECIES: phosphotransferase [Paenibacillus]GFN32326.1 hypothetical protein PCURB6_25860 [Paenibacillus curdlanolyticus]